MLPQDFQPATLTSQDLELHSESSNKAIIFSTKSSGDEAVNLELWKKTQEEVEKGWLKRLHGLRAGFPSICSGPIRQGTAH